MFDFFVLSIFPENDQFNSKICICKTTAHKKVVLDLIWFWSVRSSISIGKKPQYQCDICATKILRVCSDREDEKERKRPIDREVRYIWLFYCFGPGLEQHQVIWKPGACVVFYHSEKRFKAFSIPNVLWRWETISFQQRPATINSSGHWQELKSKKQ